MNYPLLSSKFPRELKQKEDYRYFLPSDISLAKNMNFASVFKQLEETTLAIGKSFQENEGQYLY